MRPALTFTLLVAASLAFLPIGSNAQTGDGNTSAPGSTTDENKRKMESQDEVVKAPVEMVDKAEARRIARLEREKEEERLRQERIRECVIKPVMTDAEIAKCKEVWR